MMNTPYTDQVRLLVNLLPIVGRQACFALKGGTAINLFLRDMPRLSVDIDLAYLPVEDRDASLDGIDNALGAIISETERTIPHVRLSASLLRGSNKRCKLLVQKEGTTVKVEVTPVFRGSVYPAENSRISGKAEQQFGFVKMMLLSFEDLYAGKICATLDRQHPRDLYDVYWLLQQEGFNDRLKTAFLVYLMGHNRPMSELLAPISRDISPLYRKEFEGLAFEPVELEQLQEVLPRLVQTIHAALNGDDRRFLIALKLGTQDWKEFPLPEVERLPAIQWKMFNLARMSPAKRRQTTDKLEKVLRS